LLYAKEIGNIEIIPGVEVTTDFYGSVHILGYFVDIYDYSFLSRLKKIQKGREERNKKMIRKFKDNGINITFDELEELAGGGLIGRPHMAELLVKKGYATDNDHAFSRFLGIDGICYVPRDRITPHDGISIILDSGGVAVLAHPIHVRVDSVNEFEEILLDLKTAGLTGIEAFHIDHDSADIEYYLEVAKRYDLVVTGGSDFHGRYKGGVSIGTGKGNLTIPYSFLDNLRKRLN
jgi:predicted metal-dependent phosphoesterase TrpH